MEEKDKEINDKKIEREEVENELVNVKTKLNRAEEAVEDNKNKKKELEELKAKSNNTGYDVESLEAIKNTLEKLSRDKIGIKVVDSGIGEVGENDVDMAKTCNGKILAYRVEIDKVAKDLARQGKVDISNYDVIYNLVEGVTEEMKKLLDQER